MASRNLDCAGVGFFNASNRFSFGCIGACVPDPASASDALAGVGVDVAAGVVTAAAAAADAAAAVVVLRLANTCAGSNFFFFFPFFFFPAAEAAPAEPELRPALLLVVLFLLLLLLLLLPLLLLPLLLPFPFSFPFDAPTPHAAVFLAASFNFNLLRASALRAPLPDPTRSYFASSAPETSNLQ